MKKGQFIRRVTSNGIPIGGYLQVIKGGKNLIHAKLVGCDFEDIVQKQRAITVKTADLVLEREVLERVASGRQYVIMHEATSKWKRIIESHPQLIKFRDVWGNSCIYTVEDIYYCQKLCQHDRMIKIILGRKLI